MPDDNVPEVAFQQDRKTPLAHKSAEDTTLEEKLGVFDKIEYYVPKLSLSSFLGSKFFCPFAGNFYIELIFGSTRG